MAKNSERGGGDRALFMLVLAIAISTLLVKQHLLVDVLAGWFWGNAAWRLVSLYYAHVVEPGTSAALAMPQVLRSLQPSLRLRVLPRRAK